jgi:hypothetical protein
MIGVVKEFLIFAKCRYWSLSKLPTWNPDDQARLKSYLESKSGNHLALRLRNASIQRNAKAVAKGDRWECGVGYGYMLCLTDLQTLSVASEPQSLEIFDEDRHEGANDFIARMAP